MALMRMVFSDSDLEGFLLSDQHDQRLAARNTRIDQGAGIGKSMQREFGIRPRRNGPESLSTTSTDQPEQPPLRKLAAALRPAYVRVSGTWANTTYFHNSDQPAPKTPPKGFGGVLTREQWKGVADFARAVDARLVTSFATSGGTRDAAGNWTPVQARQILDYTKSIGGSIAAAEYMNEPTYADGWRPERL
jgi:hypothetical protein